MKSFLSRAALVALALCVSACVTIASVPAGDYRVGTGYTVTLGREWSDVSTSIYNRSKKVKLLSIDEKGRLRLSRKVALAEDAAAQPTGT